jgi:hypothetical protein
MDADTLHEIELEIIQRQTNLMPYAGNAFFTDDEYMKNLLKGQYMSLESLRKWISDKYLRVLVAEDEEKEKETFSEYVRMQMETLTEHDHKLFEDMVQGYVLSGWKEEGGSATYRLLRKDGTQIKIFRNADSPQVIRTCWTAPPEVIENIKIAIDPIGLDMIKRRSQI